MQRLAFVFLAVMTLLELMIISGCGSSVPHYVTVERIDAVPEGMKETGVQWWTIDPTDRKGDTTIRLKKGQVVEIWCAGMLDRDRNGGCKRLITHPHRPKLENLFKYWPDSAGWNEHPTKQDNFPDHSVHVGCPMIQIGYGTPIPIKSHGVFRVVKGGKVKLYPNFPRGLGTRMLWYDMVSGSYDVTMRVFEATAGQHG